MPVERIPRDFDVVFKEKKRGTKKGSSKTAGSGRKKGTPNKFTTDIKEASLLAACMHGSDGVGKDALVGYMFQLARDYPETFTREILKQILPAQIIATINHSVAQTPPQRLTREELITQLQMRGINITSVNLDKSQYVSDRNLLSYKNGNGNGSNGNGDAERIISGDVDPDGDAERRGSSD